MKLLYQNCGLNWAVGIEGSPSEIEGQFDSFFHHGAIDETADLHTMSDTFAYIWSTEEKLRKYFTNSSLHILLNKAAGADYPAPWKSKKHGVLPYAESLGEKRFNEMEQETWLKFGRVGEVYELGEVKAENLSDEDA